MFALLFIVAWEPVSQADGVTVERRAVTVEGRDLFEIRVSSKARVSPEQMGETLWAHQDYEQFVPHLKKLRILSNDGKTKYVYQQVKLPMVQDRDYTLQIVRSWDAATHIYESVFEAANDKGPLVDPGYTRIQTLRGRWTIAPSEGGGSDVVYQVLTDPGAIPAWIVAMAQKAAAPDLVKAMIARAEKTHAHP